MRLPAVMRDIPLPMRLLFGTFDRLGAPMLMGRVMQHRPALFGQPFSALCETALRGSSRWSIFERELFASYSAAVEQCPY
jgi:hypothetical protein